MSALYDRLNIDLAAAMKSRDRLALQALRMTISEVKYLKAEKGVTYRVTDEDVQAALRHQIKMRREAAAQYESGGAADRARTELAEADFLGTYLPAALTAEEVELMVRQELAAIENPSPRDLGRLMGALMPKVAGRADGNAVREAVMRLLA